MTTFDVAYGSNQSGGWFTREEALLLWNNFLPVPGVIMVAGCYHNRTACFLALLGRTVHAVERLENWQAQPIGAILLDNTKECTDLISYIQKSLECQPKVIAINGFTEDMDGYDTRRVAVGILNRWTYREGRLGVWISPVSRALPPVYVEEQKR